MNVGYKKGEVRLRVEYERRGLTEWSVNERLIKEERVGRLGFPVVGQIKGVNN